MPQGSGRKSFEWKEVNEIENDKMKVICIHCNAVINEKIECISLHLKKILKNHCTL